MRKAPVRRPTTGCDSTSPGCDSCYALTREKWLTAMGQAKYGPKIRAQSGRAANSPGFWRYIRDADRRRLRRHRPLTSGREHRDHHDV
ncbi:DUF5131 family protein [Streptomyces cellulosae]|uniref:DUF5131 family protein n=1 Tax=Streptomyces cellulosae TaxID=1968 RepID=UPI00099E09D2|nr:DUF5131 family protein [Streptomyces cellulosae]